VLNGSVDKNFYAATKSLLIHVWTQWICRIVYVTQDNCKNMWR